MLYSASVRATLPVVNIKRAKKFYQEKIGLKVVKEDPTPGLLLECKDGSSIYLYQRGATKADHTVAAFTVKDIEAEVKDLKSKGIKFEDYDIPGMGLKTVNGIATMGEYKTAWFKDTEGNILGIANM